MWERIPTSNGAAADLVLGQTELTTRDAGSGPRLGESGMRWPHGIATNAEMLFVADAGSSRVMVWKDLPRANGTSCDLVLGQEDLSGADHNRAAYSPSAASLNMPYGIALQSGVLVVADTANSRLIGFDIGSLRMGAPASHLAGQSSFHDKGDNRWAEASRDSLCWPYGVSTCGSTVAIADSGNNRVLLWERA
jgi:hypothetical protein